MQNDKRVFGKRYLYNFLYENREINAKTTRENTSCGVNNWPNSMNFLILGINIRCGISFCTTFSRGKNRYKPRLNSWPYSKILSVIWTPLEIEDLDILIITKLILKKHFFKKWKIGPFNRKKWNFQKMSKVSIFFIMVKCHMNSNITSLKKMLNAHKKA